VTAPKTAYGTQRSANRANDGNPDWSPDGNRIALSRSGRDRLAEVFVMDADGKNRRRLTHG
jgi:Tol biopolymer transport system component